MSFKPPRGAVGSPYQVNCPPFYPPPPHHGPFYPPPPPPIPAQNINIYSGGSDKGQEIIDGNQDKLLSSLTTRVELLEQQSLSSLVLGEVSGTAWPGDRGFENLQSITVINTALSSILERLDNVVTDQELSDILSQYSTVQATSESILLVKDEMESDLSSSIDYLSAEIEGKGYVTSATVSAMIQEKDVDYSYLSGLQGDIDTFLSGI